MKQVFLAAPNSNGPRSFPDPFYGGLLTTEPPEPMTFAQEEERLNQLAAVEPLMEAVFFNGMPLDHYLRIRDIVQRIHQLDRSTRKRQDPEKIDHLCDAAWDQAKKLAQEALMQGLLTDERSQEL